jgi:hypothetical protein
MISRRNMLLAALLPAYRDMARLPGGTFQMGSDEGALSRQFPTAGAGLKSMLLAETPAHEVTIPGFSMDRHEVTNVQSSGSSARGPIGARSESAATTCTIGTRTSSPRARRTTPWYL